MDLIVQYITDGTLPMDPSEAKRLRSTAFQYILMNSHLYKRSFFLLLLKCLGPTDADYALRKVHEGICGNHLRGKVQAYKVLRQGYYFPIDKSVNINCCAMALRTKGIDILDPFPLASDQRKFIAVAIDYFIKLIKAEPLA